MNPAVKSDLVVVDQMLESIERVKGRVEWFVCGFSADRGEVAMQLCLALTRFGYDVDDSSLGFLREELLREKFVDIGGECVEVVF
jgi:hypothetical protein